MTSTPAASTAGPEPRTAGTGSSPRVRRRNPRGKGERLATEIVAGVEAIIVRTGSDEAVTLRSVAREVGIAAPSIYAHFADRDAILWAVVNDVFEQIRARVVAATAAHQDPVDRLVAGCVAYVTYGLENPALYRSLFARQFPGEMAAGEAVPDDAEERRRLSVGEDSFVLLVDAIGRCVAAGRSTSPDPYADATAVWTAMHGMVSLWSTICDFPWPEDRDLFVRRLVLPLAGIAHPV